MTSKPKVIDKVLVDADIVGYRCAASAENGLVEDAYDKVDDLMGYIIQETVSFPTSDTFKCYLSGKSNFRHSVAKTHGYKANRTQPKPIHLAATRDYLVREYGAVISSGCEADDLIAMEVMKGDPETTVIASLDKDFQTVNCWMFKFNTGEWVYSTKEDALKFFYTQVLTGDAVDGIKGLHGIGPKKAGKVIEGLETEVDLFEACLKAYQEHPNLEGDPYERMIENATLLHLQRYKGEIWEPPK